MADTIDKRASLWYNTQIGTDAEPNTEWRTAMSDANVKSIVRSIANAMGLGDDNHNTNDEAFVPLAQMEAEDGDEDDYRGNSVVSAEYKARYRERAETMARKPKDISAKALRRCNTDWLAIQLARLTLDEKQHTNVPALEAILSANGVKHEHWNRTTRGWQGRLRMTGRLALQRKVAENDGELVLPDGAVLKAPRTWVEKTIR
jgi:hypothetical protein